MNGSSINDQQWDVVTLKKRKQNNDSKQQKTISPEDKIEKQKKISNVLRQNIQKTRLAKKISQKELATKANLPVKTINNIENGSHIFNEQEIIKIEKAFGIKPGSLKRN